MGLFCEKLRTKIGHYLNGLKKVEKTTLESVKPSEVKSLLILSDISMPNTLQGINLLKKAFKEMCPKINFTAINFNSKQLERSETLISDTNKEYISEEDFSFFFKINNETVKEYLSREYDIIVLLTTQKQLYIDFLFKYTRGVLLIGKKNISEQLNFIVDSEIDDVNKLAETISKTYNMMFLNN